MGSVWQWCEVYQERYVLKSVKQGDNAPFVSIVDYHRCGVCVSYADVALTWHTTVCGWQCVSRARAQAASSLKRRFRAGRNPFTVSV